LLYFTHLSRSPQCVYLYQIWYRGSSRGRNQLCRIFYRLVQGYRLCWGLKFAYPHRNWRSPFRLWFQGHDIYLTWNISKMVQDRAVLKTADHGAIFNDLERPVCPISRSPLFDAEYLRNSTRYRYSFNGIIIGTYTRLLYWRISFRMILSDLEWLSEIFNDTKRRSVSLRQLSSLFLKTTRW